MNSNKINKWRESLRKNLKRLIGNPAIEAKELAAFDLIMDRRQFLKAAQFTAIGALVASVYPPTAWGRFDKKLHVNPKSVGLTSSDANSVNTATQVITGTELFQDTIYAQPVVAAEAVNTHALIEGARGRLRLQSDLLSNNPEEYTFLDGDYHLGPPELIQLEQDESGNWELVNYHYPWSARSGGARTDGLVRQVVMTKDDGLVSPTKVIAVTGSATNRYQTGTPAQINTISYLVFVEDTASGNPGYLAIGTGFANIPPPYNELPVYPVHWKSIPLDGRHINSHDNYRFADKYTNNGFKYPVEFDPIQATEHIVLYFDDSLVIISDADADQAYQEYIFLIVSVLPLPSNAPNARLVHINWDPVGSQSLKNIVLASSQSNSNGSQTYAIYATSSKNINNLDPFPIAVNIDEQKYQWKPIWDETGFTVDAATTQNGALALDYSTVLSVHSLYDLTPGDIHHLKLANFEGRGIVAFNINEQLNANSDGSSAFHLAGHFPLAFPDAAGIGKILTFSGGTSKFAGLRYVAGDEDGNVFLLRQRRYAGVDSPYAPAIWGNYTADGQPIQSFSTTDDPLPAATSSTSNLHQLANWVNASAKDQVPANYNFLLYTALAFATDDTSQSQAVWLGNGYQAAYAPSRFALDSEHVVIKQVQSGETDIYAAFTMFKNPVDKTWRQRQIATQILPEDLGIQENGDHYQATVTPANMYGKVVSVQTDDNANLLIEVRADSPCTVIDDTNNLYYDIDRYTSFMAPPDPATGRLCLLVKAETFSQVLYVRLVDTSGLQPSNGDPALLGSSTNVNTYDWQSMNLALQAQARMGNGATPTSLLGADKPIADTTVYVSGDSLAQNNQESPWQTKGDYQPTTDNLGSLATYLNTSGQNLISATGQLSLGASPDGVTIDPLYAVTSVPVDSSRPTVATQFAYDSGLVNTTTSAPSTMLGSPLGSLWSSISHALHDALHWLQNVEGEVYKDLASGGVSIVSAVDSITVTVGKDIMKQVNGVEQELNEVVTTVEEYASVVANLVVTIVESSFIYILIKSIIALISLFLHFEDILKLSDSFSNLFTDLITGANGRSLPSIPSSFSSGDIAGPYLGNNYGTQINQDLSGVDSSNVNNKLITALLDAISGNPLTKKILNKGASAVSTLLNKVNPPLPLNFDMDLTSSNIQGIMNDLSNLEETLIDGVAILGTDIISTFINGIVADIANPQQTYNNLSSELGQVADALSNALSPVFDFVDKYTKNAPAVAADMIDYGAYITLDITVLVDLCKLFKIGSPSGSKLNLKASEAVFFPLAVIAWVAVYMYNGKSISSVDDLDADFNLTSGEVGSTNIPTWNLVRLAIDLAMTELVGISFTIKSSLNINQEEPNTIEQLFIALGVWFNWIRWMNDFVYTAANWDPDTGKPFDYAWVAARLGTACTDIAFTLPLKNLNQGTGWENKDPRHSDIAQAVNFLINLSVIIYDAIEFGKTTPDTTQIVNFVGKVLPRLQIFPIFLYNLFPSTFQDNLIYFVALVLVLPFGFLLQYLAQNGELSALPPPGPGNTSPGPGRRRRRRRRPHGTGKKSGR